MLTVFSSVKPALAQCQGDPTGHQATAQCLVRVAALQANRFRGSFFFVFVSTLEKDPLQSTWTVEYLVLVLLWALLSKIFSLYYLVYGKGSSPVLLDSRGLQLMAKMPPKKSQGHHAATCPIIKKIIK